MFADLADPTEWTLIFATWGVKQDFREDNPNALWGAYGYDDSKDVMRTAMRVETVSDRADQLIIGFRNMNQRGGEMYVYWDNQLPPSRFNSGQLGARGETPTTFERRGIPPERRCSSVAYGQYAPSSRLLRRAPHRSRCYAGFNHGLLGDRRRAPAPAGGPASWMMTAAPAPFTHRQILIIYSGLMAGMFLAALDQMIVSTALPTIVGELGGLDYYSWVVTAYLLAGTITPPIFGKLGDIYGRRITFQVAVAIFLLGSLMAGLASGMMELVLARGVQGVGAGGVMTLTFAIIGDVVPARQRGRYIGYLGSVWAVASVVGPLTGGFIVDTVSWRWVFLINLPIGAMVLAVIGVVLKLPATHRPARLDVAGAMLLTAGVSLVLLALVQIEQGGLAAWRTAAFLGTAGAGVALLAGFVWWETVAEEPLLPLRLFRVRIFSVCSGISLATGSAFFGTVVFLPLFPPGGDRSVGHQLRPAAAAADRRHRGGSAGSGRLIAATGRYRIYPIAGSICTVIGMALLSVMSNGTSRVVISGTMLVAGLGFGMLLQTSLLAVQNAVEHRHLGVATSSAQFFRLMGGSFGVAIFGAIMNVRLATELPARLPAATVAEVGGEVTRLLQSPTAIRALPPEVAAAVASALEVSIQTIFVVAVPITIVGVVLAFMLDEIPLRETIGSEVAGSSPDRKESPDSPEGWRVADDTGGGPG